MISAAVMESLKVVGRCHLPYFNHPRPEPQGNKMARISLWGGFDTPTEPRAVLELAIRVV